MVFFNRSLNDVVPYILRKFNNKVYSSKWSSFLHFLYNWNKGCSYSNYEWPWTAREHPHHRGMIFSPYTLDLHSTRSPPYNTVAVWSLSRFDVNYLNFWQSFLSIRETTWIQTCKVRTILWEILFEVLFFPTRTHQIHRWILYPFVPYSALTINWTGYCLIMCCEAAFWVCCLTPWNTQAAHCAFYVLTCLVSDSIGGKTRIICCHKRAVTTI